MNESNNYAIIFPAAFQAEVAAATPFEPDLVSTQIEGRTLASLVSAGTELAQYTGTAGSGAFPATPGYAAVFEVTNVGAEVSDFAPGDLAFTMGRHRSNQRCEATEAIRVPDRLCAEHAVFARLMGVSMTTLTTTKARPGDMVAVTGLGPVGHLAAQMFNRCGYHVIGADPMGLRCDMLQRFGIDAAPRLPLNSLQVAGHVALAIECSGREDATMDCCNIVANGGEVVLVGVPWKAHTNILAHAILDRVFHKYITLRSGWEWEIPRHPEKLYKRTLFGNFATALDWLAEGSIVVDSLYESAVPEQANEVYRQLHERKVDALTVLFDWTR